MANPEAVMRAAKAPPKPYNDATDSMPGGPNGPANPPPAPPAGPTEGPKPEGAGGGLDGMVGSLKGVGAFLQDQAQKGDPEAGEAMNHFQALLGSMSKMGGGGTVDLEKGAGPAPGAMELSKAPGVKVL